MMRVRFQMSGGIAYFPGFALPRTVDVETLPEDTRLSVMRLIEETQFFSLPSSPPIPGAADYRTYRITIEDGARQHTVVLSDPVSSAPLQALIQLLQNL